MKNAAATHRATSWVDGKVIGTLTYELTGNLRVMMGASTNKIGNDINLNFDHTTLSIGGTTIEFCTTGQMP